MLDTIPAVKTKIPNSMHQIALQENDTTIRLCLNRFTNKHGELELSKSTFVILKPNDAIVLSNLLLEYAKHIQNEARKFEILESARDNFIRYGSVKRKVGC